MFSANSPRIVENVCENVILRFGAYPSKKQQQPATHLIRRLFLLLLLLQIGSTWTRTDEPTIFDDGGVILCKFAEKIHFVYTIHISSTNCTCFKMGWFFFAHELHANLYACSLCMHNTCEHIHKHVAHWPLFMYVSHKMRWGGGVSVS